MKKNVKKLALTKEAIRRLQDSELKQIAAGRPDPQIITITVSCPERTGCFKPVDELPFG